MSSRTFDTPYADEKPRAYCNCSLCEETLKKPPPQNCPWPGCKMSCKPGRSSCCIDHPDLKPTDTVGLACLAPSLSGGRDARKAVPMFDGLLGYFPNACAYVSHVSARANEQHNPGEPMHWAADKSIGTGNEIVRHLAEHGSLDSDGLRHTGKVAWRALELLERELLNSDPTLKPGINVRNFTRASAEQKDKK